MIFWFFALVGTATSIILLGLMIAGIGNKRVDTEVDNDSDSGSASSFSNTEDNSDDSELSPELSFQIFSFKSIMGFISGFGWGGILARQISENKTMINLIAIVIGILFSLLISALVFFFLKSKNKQS